MEESSIYREKTKEIMREFVQREGRRGYEKLQGSSYQGFMYEKKAEESNRNITFDIKLPDEGTMILKAASGIHVSRKAYLPAIKRYCQEISINYGAINVDTDVVQFHIEDCLMENPVSIETLEMYESEAIRILELHFENLHNLAVGRTLSITPVKESNKKTVKNKYNCTDSIDLIRDYLSNRSRYNAVCEKIDENNNTAFYCQILTGEKSFRLSFNFTNDGILVLKGTYGENAFVVPEPYRYAVADYLNDINAMHKYAVLSMGSGGEGVSCSICTSLLDGIVGDKTIEFMEHILLKTLSDSIEEIETLGAGLVLKEDKENEGMEELAKTFVESEAGKVLMNAISVMENSSMPLPGRLNPFADIAGPGRTLSDRIEDSFLSDLVPADDDEISMSEFADVIETSIFDEETDE